MRIFATILALAFVLSGTPGPELKVVPIGRFDFSGGDHADSRLRAEGLSGITYIGDDEYLVVGDRHATVHRLTIRIDPATGEIVSAGFGQPVLLKNADCEPLAEPEYGPDREAIVYDAASRSVVIANERAGTSQDRPSLARHALETGCLLQELDVSSHADLQVFGHIRRNLGFEALGRHPDSGFIWTANEEALRIDGSRPTDEDGTLVRLQMFSADMRPLAQHAYRVDPLPAPRPPGGLWSSGVADVIALPHGRLLVMERALVGLVPPLGSSRIRLYEAAVRTATPLGVEARGGLEKAGSYHTTAKSLLNELLFGVDGLSNFEGAALGPRLANGDYSIVYLADNNTGVEQSLYALRITGVE